MKERVTRAQSQAEWSGVVRGSHGPPGYLGQRGQELSVAVKAAGMEPGLGGYGSGTSA